MVKQLKLLGLSGDPQWYITMVNGVLGKEQFCPQGQVCSITMATRTAAGALSQGWEGTGPLNTCLFAEVRGMLPYLTPGGYPALQGS